MCLELVSISFSQLLNFPSQDWGKNTPCIWIYFLLRLHFSESFSGFCELDFHEKWVASILWTIPQFGFFWYFLMIGHRLGIWDMNTQKRDSFSWHYIRKWMLSICSNIGNNTSVHVVTTASAYESFFAIQFHFATLFLSNVGKNATMYAIILSFM